MTDGRTNPGVQFESGIRAGSGGATLVKQHRRGALGNCCGALMDIV